MRLVWVTDPHLNFLRVPGSVEAFIRYLREETNCAAFVFTGDLSEAPQLHQHLFELEQGAEVPVYFVLGNHDHYNGSFEESHEIATQHPGYLERRVVELSPEVCLIGQDGWYDAQFGDPQAPRFGMNDWRLIRELHQVPGNPFYNNLARKHNVAARRALIEECRRRAEEQTRIAEETLLRALDQYRTVVFATHVPPFDQATWHEGQMSEPKWIPWFSSKVMGEMLLRIMDQHPEKRLIVLCGHTHGSGIHRPSPNVTVLTGEAYYYRPGIAGMFNVDGDEVRVSFVRLGQVESVPV